VDFSEDRKKKLLVLMKQYPRRSDFQKLTIEADLVEVAKNYVSIVRPFFEFVIIKDGESFEPLGEVLNKGQLKFLGKKVSDYGFLSECLKDSGGVINEQKETRRRLVRQGISGIVTSYGEIISFLQTQIFVLLSEMEEELPQDLYKRPLSETKKVEENGK